MNKKEINTLIIALSIALTQNAFAGGKEKSNNCRTTEENVCERSGSCAIQGSSWSQTVRIDKNDAYDTQGWPGLCDMVHVNLVQGFCSPSGAQENVTANLSETSFAKIPSISGKLTCGGEGGKNIEICNDGVDNDGDGQTDCDDKWDCQRDKNCR